MDSLPGKSFSWLVGCSRIGWVVWLKCFGGIFASNTLMETLWDEGMSVQSTIVHLRIGNIYKSTWSLQPTLSFMFGCT